MPRKELEGGRAVTDRVAGKRGEAGSQGGGEAGRRAVQEGPPARLRLRPPLTFQLSQQEI